MHLLFSSTKSVIKFFISSLCFIDFTKYRHGFFMYSFTSAVIVSLCPRCDALQGIQHVGPSVVSVNIACAVLFKLKYDGWWFCFW